MVFGNNAIYQMRGNYLLERDSDLKKYVGLRPDITIKKSSGMMDIIDTKWKIPKNFAKEADTYQMNAYSSSIKNVERIILLYPHVSKESIVDDYSFIDLKGNVITKATESSVKVSKGVCVASVKSSKLRVTILIRDFILCKIICVRLLTFQLDSPPLKRDSDVLSVVVITISPSK